MATIEALDLAHVPASDRGFRNDLDEDPPECDGVIFDENDEEPPEAEDEEYGVLDDEDEDNTYVPLESRAPQALTLDPLGQPASQTQTIQPGENVIRDNPSDPSSDHSAIVECETVLEPVSNNEEPSLTTTTPSETTGEVNLDSTSAAAPLSEHPSLGADVSEQTAHTVQTASPASPMGMVRDAGSAPPCNASADPTVNPVANLIVDKENVTAALSGKVLQEQCALRKLPKSGNKQALVERILSHILANPDYEVGESFAFDDSGARVQGPVPFHKVDPILDHLRDNSIKNWDLGPDVSQDEIEIGFQGRCSLKDKIKYKGEGGGFLADAICDRGKKFGTGVCRTSGRGLPACVQQDLVTRKADLEAAIGTVTPYQRLNWIDFYNLTMNSVDLADQYRNQYRMDGPWMRQKKWWWAICLWSLEAAWGNAYLCYRQMCVQAKKEKYLSHRKFLEAGKRAVKITSKMMDNMITKFVGKHPMKSLVNVTHCQWCKFKVKVAGEKRKRDLSADSVDDGKKNPRAQFGCEACNVWFCGPECWNEFHGLT
ncbi:hypothetical protein CYMTET_46160 [Cymbomonas tetramitiformis]|uniref:SAP domain-containing protein n=1 Tax=Cymbomonas tetramitiformis TaxID=36881 RepID=A0AAE0BYK3_9CHLO|nr:hypothetical protein CYMTET_46160 [Cymbomonas tetramitiformis]